jgi:hypothetical protein
LNDAAKAAPESEGLEVEEQVGWFQIAMHDAARVGLGERLVGLA